MRIKRTTKMTVMSTRHRCQKDERLCLPLRLASLAILGPIAVFQIDETTLRLYAPARPRLPRTTTAIRTPS